MLKIFEAREPREATPGLALDNCYSSYVYIGNHCFSKGLKPFKNENYDIATQFKDDNIAIA